jgi:hypothetical protein
MRLVPTDYARGPTHRTCHGIRWLCGFVEDAEGVLLCLVAAIMNVTRGIRVNVNHATAVSLLFAGVDHNHNPPRIRPHEV